MSMDKEIKQVITHDFAPDHLEVINESHKHKGHAGDDGSGETHYKLIVVTGKFSGKSRIERHKEVNKSVGTLFDKGLHALSLKLYTPEELRE